MKMLALFLHKRSALTVQSSDGDNLQALNVIRAGDDTLHPFVAFDWRHSEQKARAMKAGMESLPLRLELRSTLGGETASHLGAASGSALRGQS